MIFVLKLSLFDYYIKYLWYYIKYLILINSNKIMYKSYDEKKTMERKKNQK